ncbi:hypothetical protein L596_008608 [Steinernema carpocapsae]|uniref:Uncharacterized protein n=1 Tax=Steinernema carpocapsae TaxID=34508 RepID=A0A4U5PDU0_STECR|nr:hypothetical protein L596_008608 [Steinernema carpocapsae]
MCPTHLIFPINPHFSTLSPRRPRKTDQKDQQHFKSVQLFASTFSTPQLLFISIEIRREGEEEMQIGEESRGIDKENGINCLKLIAGFGGEQKKWNLHINFE